MVEYHPDQVAHLEKELQFNEPTNSSRSELSRAYRGPNIANATPRMKDCRAQPIAHTPPARHVLV